MTGRGTIVRVSGSVVVARLRGAGLLHRISVGRPALPGEAIRVDGDLCTVQVYEDTRGLRVGDPVVDTGVPFSTILGPGLLGGVFDGVQRPLDRLLDSQGPWLRRGAEARFEDDARTWDAEPRVRPGEPVEPGRTVAVVAETPGVTHRVLCPPGRAGVVDRVWAGPRRLSDPVCRFRDGTVVTLAHPWPSRVPRPHRGRLPPDAVAVTGQRVLDCFFPLAHGGLAVVPGGFGTGKTVLEQLLAASLDVDVVVYVGCGERGNEMADLLHGFRELEDPRTGRPLLERTVLVVNTSNMPVAARETSVYTGITVAEYYRDMGYRVAFLADSVSRWAEALRELSSRLEELPGEEGYPPYLASRLGEFCERAGRVRCLDGDREGSVTAVLAVSPPGGDLSEPVSQACLRLAGCFWPLDPALAAGRHFPAVDWREGFSLYRRHLAGAWRRLAGEGWQALCDRVAGILARGEEVQEVAQLVGYDALQEAERFELDLGRAVREGFLQQDASDPLDGFCPPARARALMETIAAVHDRGAGGGAVGRDDLAGLARLRRLDPEALERVRKEVTAGGPLRVP